MELKKKRENRIGIREEVWLYLLGFLAARSEIAGLHPFAIAVFAGSYLAGQGSWGLLVALLLGIASTGEIGSCVKYTGIIVGMIVVISLISGKDRTRNPLLVAGIAGSMTIGIGMLYILTPWGNDQLFYLPLMEGIAVAGFSVILEQAFQVLHNHEDIMQSENLLSTLTLLAVVLWGIPLQVLYYFTLLQGVIYYLILYMAYRFGVAYGASVGTVCGVILAIRTHQVEWVAICVILSMAAGFLGEFGKTLETLGFLTVLGFLGFFYYPELLEVAALRGLLTAGLLFICTPKSYMMKRAGTGNHMEQDTVQWERQTVIKKHIQETAAVFHKLSRTFCQPAYTVQGNGQAAGYAAPVFARQMGEIGENLAHLSATMEEPAVSNGERQALLVHQLERQNIRVRQLTQVQGIYGRKEIYLSARTLHGRVMTTKEIAGIISRCMDTPYRPTASSRMILNREYHVVQFEEDVRYRYLMGVKRVAKDGQVVSGDNFSQMELKNGQLLMLLADGMGSGVEASRQSEQLVDLLEEMLEAGFRKESAIELLNELIAVQGQGEQFATMDMCMLDLYSGVGEFLKMGASATFIKRGDWMETIQSTTLPVGVREQTEIDAIRKKFYHGDMVIMVSDGVLDAILFENKEECLKELILEIDTTNPQEMAEELLTRVQEISKNQMRDDASILVLGIWRK